MACLLIWMSLCWAGKFLPQTKKQPSTTKKFESVRGQNAGEYLLWFLSQGWGGACMDRVPGRDTRYTSAWARHGMGVNKASIVRDSCYKAPFLSALQISLSGLYSKCSAPWSMASHAPPRLSGQIVFWVFWSGSSKCFRYGSWYDSYIGDRPARRIYHKRFLAAAFIFVISVWEVISVKISLVFLSQNAYSLKGDNEFK